MKLASSALLKVLGILLLTAAVLKGLQLLTEPVANSNIWSYRPFLILTVELELALAIWLLSGPFKKAAWLAGLRLMNGSAGLSPENKAKVLALLQTEVNTAYELGDRVMRLFVASEDQPCDECQALLDGIIEDIRTIISTEKEIMEYEARK